VAFYVEWRPFEILHKTECLGVNRIVLPTVCGIVGVGGKIVKRWFVIALLLALPAEALSRPGTAREDVDDYYYERLQMVRMQIEKRGIQDKAVIKAMRTVPRHELVPASVEDEAYSDHPLPIGHGQTISQPYIVALMTELLELEPDDVVLEVGTGSGYQAAILGQIVSRVVSLEIIGNLANRARRDLERLGYTNIKVKHRDGYGGDPKKAPFDAIVVTAAATHIPPPLLKQLKPGGIMVIPVGGKAWTQNLILVKKDEEGTVTSENILPVRFVPLTRKRR
jgi:protein-L-isoaspartate(D-aspartate) O-methyltransferase